jgi:iron(III) transport system substrate-binding protein
MKKLRPNVQLYTKSGGGGTLPVGLGQAGGGIFFIVDALDTKAKGYDVTISFPKEGIGTAAEGIALIKGAKNPELGKKLIDWATSPRCRDSSRSTRSTSCPRIRQSPSNRASPRC